MELYKFTSDGDKRSDRNIIELVESKIPFFAGFREHKNEMYSFVILKPVTTYACPELVSFANQQTFFLDPKSKKILPMTTSRHLEDLALLKKKITSCTEGSGFYEGIGSLNQVIDFFEKKGYGLSSLEKNTKTPLLSSSAAYMNNHSMFKI